MTMPLVLWWIWFSWTEFRLLSSKIRPYLLFSEMVLLAIMLFLLSWRREMPLSRLFWMTLLMMLLLPDPRMATPLMSLADRTFRLTTLFSVPSRFIPISPHLSMVFATIKVLKDLTT